MSATMTLRHPAATSRPSFRPDLPVALPSPAQLLAVAEALPGASAVVLDGRMVVQAGNERWFTAQGVRRSEACGRPMGQLLTDEAMQERATICATQRARGESLVMRGIRDGAHEIILCLPASEHEQERIVWIEMLAAGAPLTDAQPRTVYPGAHTWGALAALTMRQLDVARLVGMGLSNERIAQLQSVSRRTTEWHMRSIYDALGVDERAEVARLAIRAGLSSFPLDAWQRILRRRDRERAREAFARARGARAAVV